VFSIYEDTSSAEQEVQTKELIATVKINMLLLAVGPSQCRVAIKSPLGFVGILQFQCAVQQIEKVTVALNQFKVDVEGLVGSRITADFKLTAPTVFGKGEHEVV